MGGYIRIDKDQPIDSRLVALADLLAQRWQLVYGGNNDLPPAENCHALRHMLLGVTVTLWSHADTYIRSDDSLPVTLSGLAQILNVPLSILEQFPPSWLTTRAEDGLAVLPGYCKRNGLIAKDIRKRNGGVNAADYKREGARLRKQRQREKARVTNERDASVTVTRDKRDRGVTTGTGTHPIPVPGGSAAPLAAVGAAAAPRKSFAEEFAQRFGLAPKVPA